MLMPRASPASPHGRTSVSPRAPLAQGCTVGGGGSGSSEPPSPPPLRAPSRRATAQDRAQGCCAAPALLEATSVGAYGPASVCSRTAPIRPREESPSCVFSVFLSNSPVCVVGVGGSGGCREGSFSFVKREQAKLLPWHW